MNINENNRRRFVKFALKRYPHHVGSTWSGPVGDGRYAHDQNVITIELPNWNLTFYTFGREILVGEGQFHIYQRPISQS